jgi:hypothetical protein
MKKRPTNQSQPSANNRPHHTPRQDGKQQELFERPAINPRWPTPGTLVYEALARMLSGERLTQISFGFHGWRLAAYVKELQYLGWSVCKGEAAAPAAHKTRKPIREYFLLPETILAARTGKGAA